MTDNEKAAVASGLWEPGKLWSVTRIISTQTLEFLCESDDKGAHPLPAPDMHDPANLWRALENREYFRMLRRRDGIWTVFGPWPFEHEHGVIDIADSPSLVEAVFIALVRLYDAEHPAETQKCQI